MSAATAYVPYDQIVSKLPIHEGDILYVISHILDLAMVCRDHGERFDCEKWIISLQKAVGKKGTLLFPTFNWDFCKGVAFDYHKTECKTGVLGKTALKMPGFKRTQHPLYSFAVWGKAQEDLVALDNKSGFGDNSPFAYMHTHRAKEFVIGLPASKGNTFLHYAEQMVGVWYRSEKNFSAPYTNEKGHCENRTYSMYVRDLDIDPRRKWSYVIEGILSSLGISKDFDINGVPFHVIDAQGMFDVASLDLRYNDANNLYTFSKAPPERN